jgi:hypothetical protein
MISPIDIQMSANWVSVKSNENAVDQRSWHNSQLHEFGVILKHLLHVKDAISNREVALPCRLAVNVVQRLDIALRLAQGRIGNNVEQQARDWVVKQSSFPGVIARDSRPNSTIGVSCHLCKGRRRCVTRWVENVLGTCARGDSFESFEVLGADVLQAPQDCVKKDARSSGWNATVQQTKVCWMVNCVRQVI